MTVYVDDASIVDTVGRITSHWSHRVADEQDELHAFAARLGLRWAWFQDPTRTGKTRARAGSRAAENWHYDVTAAKRVQAIRLGAVPITWRQAVEVIDRRYHAARAAAERHGQR